MRAGQPSKSSVKHASHEAKAYRTGQGRRETHIQRGLTESGGTQRRCTQNLTTKSSKQPHAIDPHKLCAVPKHANEAKNIQTCLTSTAGAKYLKAR